MIGRFRQWRNDRWRRRRGWDDSTGTWRKVGVGLTTLVCLTSCATGGGQHQPQRAVPLAPSRFLLAYRGWGLRSATTVPPTTVPVVTIPKPHPTTPRASRSRGSGPCDRPSNCPQLRACENGGSYGAGTNPRYYGAYQFADRSTWGMTPAEQDAHADQMYAQRGAQPWPVCGKYLK